MNKNRNLKININNDNFKTNNNDQFLMTADNFHSKKINYNNEEPKKNEIKLEKEANNIIENKIIPNKIEEKKLEFKKHDSPIKNIIKNFKNIDNNPKIEPDLFSNRNQRPKKLVLGKEKKYQ